MTENMEIFIRVVLIMILIGAIILTIWGELKRSPLAAWFGGFGSALGLAIISHLVR
jgi:hypothetical protein